MAQWGKVLATQPGGLSWLLRPNIKVERDSTFVLRRPHTRAVVHLCVHIHKQHAHTQCLQERKWNFQNFQVFHFNNTQCLDATSR